MTHQMLTEQAPAAAHPGKVWVSVRCSCDEGAKRRFKKTLLDTPDLAEAHEAHAEHVKTAKEAQASIVRPPIARGRGRRPTELRGSARQTAKDVLAFVAQQYGQAYGMTPENIIQQGHFEAIALRSVVIEVLLRLPDANQTNVGYALGTPATNVHYLLQRSATFFATMPGLSEMAIETAEHFEIRGLDYLPIVEPFPEPGPNELLLGNQTSNRLVSAQAGNVAELVPNIERWVGEAVVEWPDLMPGELFRIQWRGVLPYRSVVVVLARSLPHHPSFTIIGRYLKVSKLLVQVAAERAAAVFHGQPELWVLAQRIAREHNLPLMDKPEPEVT